MPNQTDKILEGIPVETIDDIPVETLETKTESGGFDPTFKKLREAPGTEALLRGGAYGLSLGTAPAIEAAAQQIGSYLKGQVPPRGSQEFRQMVMERAKPYEEFKKKYPTEFGAGEITGTLASSLATSGIAGAGGRAAAQLVPTTSPIARGITQVGTEAALEAGAGGLTAATQGQDVTGGALLGALGSVGGQALRTGSEAVSKIGKLPQTMKQEAIQSAPEALKSTAARMAESPEALEQYRMAGYELKKPGGLEEQLTRVQGASENEFKQIQSQTQAANAQKTADYQAALREEDKIQNELLKHTTEAVRKARTEDAANKLADSVRRGLALQRQKADVKYDLAYKAMTDQVDPAASPINRIIGTYNSLDPSAVALSVDTRRTIEKILQRNSQALPGGYTTGMELKNLVDLDKSLSSDISTLMSKPGMSSTQDTVARLQLIKQELSNAINKNELGIPKEALDQYNQAKSHYAEYAKARDELQKAQLLAQAKIGKRKVLEPSAQTAAQFLSPAVEDYTKTADVQRVLGGLPSDVEGVPAMTQQQFQQLKQQATTMPAGLLPERTRPVMPAPELQPVPTQRVVSPEEQALAGQIETKRGMAGEYEELARPPTEGRSDFVPGKIGLVQKALGVSPVAKISRAQAVEQAFKNPGLSFAVRVLEGQKKLFTPPLIQMLARQYQVDPMELQKTLAEQQTP